MTIKHELDDIPALQALQQTAITALLDDDPRPTCILDVHDHQAGPPVFCNAALHAQSQLFTLVSAPANASLGPRQRATSRAGLAGKDGYLDSTAFAGMQWDSYLVDARWRVLSNPRSPSSARTSFSIRNSATAAGEHKSYDWTAEHAPAILSPHVQRLRDFDWASTPVGPLNKWPSQLRCAVNVMMSDPDPACVLVGKDMHHVYNEAFTALAGPKHPALIGRPFVEGWPELWDEVKAVFEEPWRTRQAIKMPEASYFMPSDIGVEEIFLSYTLLPVLGEDGDIIGLYQKIADITRETLTWKRMILALSVNREISGAVTLDEFYQRTVAGLAQHEKEIPFALLYSANSDSSSPLADSSPSWTFNLVGNAGLPHDTPASTIDLQQPQDAFLKTCLSAVTGGQQVILRTADGTLPENFAENFDKGDEARLGCDSAVLCPLWTTASQHVHSFIIIGLNKARRYDQDYKDFISLICGQLTSTMASISLYTAEIQRGIEEAALDKAKLSKELKKISKETRQMETRWQRVTELAPVGICIFADDGAILYANDKWFNMAAHPPDDLAPMSWIGRIWEEDLPNVVKQWETRFLGENRVFEFRFKKPDPQPGDPTPFFWVLANCYPELNEDGQCEFVHVTLTDINHQKLGELDAQKQATDALEAKRQLENFMDMTSHEIRNPLNAILQCADAVIEFVVPLLSVEKLPGNIKDCVEAAQTIAHCAQHQRRVVDDILVLSKLDSDLVSITPTPSRPMELLKQLKNIFEVQSHKAQVKLVWESSGSLGELGIQWAIFDPSRVLQILINLIGNAIKFTSKQEKRRVSIHLSASKIRPKASEISDTFRYIPSKEQRHAIPVFADSDYEVGEEIFLSFRVQDTGRGITNEEREKLFKRFSQASPRTHVQYGGSGLGLYISRELTERQGGEIGLTSTSGEGSLFSFYVKAYIATPRHAHHDDVAPISVLVPESMRTELSPSNSHDSLVTTQKHSESPRLAAEVLHRRENGLENGRRLSISATPIVSEATVLIVEDNLVNQRVLKKQLSKVVKNIYVANHGLEALEFLRRTRYWSGRGANMRQSVDVNANGVDGDDNEYDESDNILAYATSREPPLELSLVLMDWEMPVMNGLECVKEMRALEERGEVSQRIPVIGVTANARQEQVILAKEAGMDEVVTKPFRIPKLVQMMEQILKVHCTT